MSGVFSVFDERPAVFGGAVVFTSKGTFFCAGTGAAATGFRWSSVFLLSPPNSDWEFYHAGDNKKTEDHLKPVAAAPVPAQKNVPLLVQTTAPPKHASRP